MKKNGKKGVDKDEVDNIRSMYRRDFTITEISEAYGVSYHSIRNIVNYKTFKSI